MKDENKTEPKKNQVRIFFLVWTYIPLKQSTSIVIVLNIDFYVRKKYLKVASATFLLVCFLSLNESTCQTRKNAFYFTSKTLFVLEKIKF